MPLSEERRKQLEALAGGASISSPSSTPTVSPSMGNPPPGLELQSVSLSGGKPTMRFVAPKPQGTKGLDPDARRIFSQAKAARAQIAQIWDEANTLIPATESSGYRAIPAGIFERTKTAIGGNEPARAFRQTLKAKLRNVARSLGERGVITDKDIENFVAAMPDFTDSTVSREVKRNSLLGGVDSLVNAFTTNKYGIPFTPDIPETSTTDKAKALLKRHGF